MTLRIYLSNSKKTSTVSRRMFYELNKYSWRISSTGYVIRTCVCSGKRCDVYMHRQIMGCSTGDGIIVDHIDMDKLNNTDENLRKSTQSMNHMNRLKTRANTTGYKGVYRNPSGTYYAKIVLKGRQIRLGTRKSKRDAAKLYDFAANLYHGEFARLNFPERGKK